MPEQNFIEWNDEQIATLKALWPAGAPVEKIAEAIGHPGERNAVIGKARRLRLGKHPMAGVPVGILAKRTPQPKSQSVAAARDGLRKSVPESRYLTSGVWSPPPGAAMLGLLEINDATCKWPYGDPLSGDFGFCGHPPEQRPQRRPTDPVRFYPYCAHHRAIATTTKQEIENGKDHDGVDDKSSRARNGQYRNARHPARVG